MNEANARTVANVLVASAGLAAAYVIVTTPPLRRMALRVTRLWLGASLPLYLVKQAREAWVASGRPAT